MKLDSTRLLGRIKGRAPEYMQIFSSQRIREHFKGIFKTKYPDIPITELKYCSEEVLLGLDRFYGKVDDLHCISTVLKKCRLRWRKTLCIK